MSRSRFQLQQMALQARLFRMLAHRSVDAKTFIAAFMNSSAAEGLDAPYDRMQWAGEEYIYETVVDEAGLKPAKSRRRYSPDALFYAGYIYRYWHYLTGETSKEIYRQADADQILASFGYHTESNKLAVEDLKRAAEGNSRRCPKNTLTTSKEEEGAEEEGETSLHSASFSLPSSERRSNGGRMHPSSGSSPSVPKV